MPELEIRLAAASRAYVAVFGVVWCASVAVAGVRGLRAGSAASLVTLPMLVAGAAMAYRLFRLGVVAENGTLVVRNRWSTRRLRRVDVEDFRTGGLTTRGFPGSQAVQVLLRDRTVLALDVTTSSWPLPRSRTRLHERLQQLREWQAG